ncbi:MAG: APC family permease [Carbonactinosporaceae bacterium]
MASTQPNAGQGPRLRRDLGPMQSYATIIGTLVGAGIFVVTGQAGADAGPGVVLAYLVLAPVILSTALAYSVYLSTPLGEKPGGAYIHMSRTHGFYFLGYILMWLKWVAFIGALGVLSLSLARYLTFFLPDIDPTLTAVAVLAVFYLVNLVGVRYFGIAQVVMFLVLVAAIAILVVPGVFAIEASNLTPLLPFGWSGLLAVLAPLFFAYAGFESLAQTAGETRDARRSLPRIFLLGVTASVVIYVSMSLVAFGVVPYQELARSDAAMADVSSHYLPAGGAAVVAIGAIMAFTTSINASLMVPSRLLYVLADDRVVPRFLAHVNHRWRTPDVALTISAAVGVVLLSTRTLDYMLNVALQALFLLYGIHSLTMAALPFLRRGLYERANVRPPVWLLVPAGLFSAAWMGYFTYRTLPSVIGLLGVWTAVGAALYGAARWQGAREGFDYRRRLVEEWADEPLSPPTNASIAATTETSSSAE